MLLWNNKRLVHKVLGLLLVLFIVRSVALPAEADEGPKLLLNAQRMRRLKRDRERNTVRWMNFEKRVNTFPDSPERGFELALYYVITSDENRGREAVQWALLHPSDRQAALVLDWCRPLIPVADRQKLGHCVVPGNSGAPAVRWQRDCLFKEVAAGTFQAEGSNSRPRFDISSLEDGGFQNAATLYAACELIYVLRSVQHVDLRENAREFFSQLPNELLVSIRPKQLDHPEWLMHVAALALVAIDPNLPGSQFLQGWAMEDRQMIHDGPGVGYELLWADPYLPGVGYQNMDSWVYSQQGQLFARAGWDTNSCWISISAHGVETENCPPNLAEVPAAFGKLTLLPMTDRCIEIPRTANNESVIVWKLKPRQQIQIGKGSEHHTGEADPAGMWRPGANIEGKACINNR